MSPLSPDAIVQAVEPDHPLMGLSHADVQQAMAQGLTNKSLAQGSQSYARIIRDNVFNFINIILFALGLTLIILGRASDAVVAVGVVLINVIVSVVQEVRAKRILDAIAVLTRPRATVIRDGTASLIALEAVVLHDVLVVRPGDQIVADGCVLRGQMGVDESLLTGESTIISKGLGTEVLSGTFCVAGMAWYRADKVGSASAANQLTQRARRYRRTITPVQREMHRIIQFLIVITLCFELLLVASALIHRMPLVDTVRMSVVVASLIPIGLFLATSVAYALGTMRMARRGVLIQQTNAIESLSHVDILCLDKTGTLTTNQLVLHELLSFTDNVELVRAWLGAYVASETGGNHTSAAIAAACPGVPRTSIEEVPFISARQWSAQVIADQDMQGMYFVGAPDILIAHMTPSADIAVISERVAQYTTQGLRAVLFGMAPLARFARDAQGEPQLPSAMQALALVILADELRPEARTTLAEFGRAGIDIKLISGDHPDTVAALARQAGLLPDGRVTSGLDLAAMSAAAFALAAATNMVFGRIAPQQKERLVQALRQQGHYVAMIGDGVNDILSLKQADVGIAMQSGSQATRNSADIVLLHDSFAPLPQALLEGQRIRNGMENIMKLFLTRSVFVALVIVGVAMAADGFPFSPKQNAVLAFLTGGIPALVLALWAPPGKPQHTSIFPALVRFVVPAGISLSLVGIGLYVGYTLVLMQLTLNAQPTLTSDQALALTTPLAQSALTTFAILGNLVLILFVVPPTRGGTGGAVPSNDHRPAWLALGILGLFMLIASIPAGNRFFELGGLHLSDIGIISGVTVLWAVALRWLWRTRLLERFVAGEVGQAQHAPDHITADH